MNFDTQEALGYLQSVMGGNKALGLLGQLDFERWIAKQELNVRNKYFPGCWMISSKDDQFFALKTCFFVIPKITTNSEVDVTIKELESNRQFQALNSALKSGGFEVMHCLPISDTDPPVIKSIGWRIFRYYNERLQEQDNSKYFELWRGTGRPSSPKQWKPEQEAKFKVISDSDLTAIVLPQLFYNGFFKAVYKAGTVDPYDTDGFIISYDGKIFPVELKEKFPFSTKRPTKKQKESGQLVSYPDGLMRIGVDVGRVVMMLRICLPINSNGYYIVREVENTPERKLKKWKYIRLDEIIMKCSWQVQSGGPGMSSGAGGAGTDTSTIILPYTTYSDLTPDLFSDIMLKEHGTLTDGTRKLAEQFATHIKSKFGFTD